ncbi:MAG: DNA-formamidopyrimidine glycosylase [Candidatus Magasanikbacteria bacterium RIFCSPHIGHO2_02_FULL_45_10]|uniref:DNA-formamidopyrimidine glycosylase n=1 Tax=Candidatus Magasanikbacteria bacterium RIFCSPHIGHO2_02_FULL_45_10 TaxID=1798679 RepID=A0A1F6MBJ3_9BACT|nr:MAG: DNA-formamidopyrimidine glycosylase [Candidatus Magasanikbacteria bacterium RIFCSPHIGHO2_02_FULL_45_10]
MPELPEVETIRQDLRQKILNTKIVQVKVLREKAVRSSTFSLPKNLTGKMFSEVERVGKLLMLKVGERYLLIHLKMTGQLIYIKHNKIIAGGHSFPALNTQLPDKHTQIIITFKDGGILYFNDMRRFGYARLVTAAEKEKIAATYGIEPLTSSFTYQKFSEVLNQKKTILKALLLNQAYFAGIGNIYADEICHEARVLPNRRANTLTEAETKKFYNATKKILTKAVRYRGTTFNNYLDGEGKKGNFVSFLKVYNRDGLKCKICKKSLIHKKTLAGRGTHYCPVCQR